MDAKTFIKKTMPEVKALSQDYTFQELRPSAEMQDGFKVSIQASHTHYCSPREDGLEFYSQLELGYPSSQDEIIMPYAENPDQPTNTVYGYVPIDVIEELVKKHGGIKEANI